MALDCSGNTTGPAFVATQEFLVTYCLTFVCFILFVVPFRVHFIDISWKLLQLHILLVFLYEHFVSGTLLSDCIGQPMNADIFRCLRQNHRRIHVHRTNSDYNLYHHLKMNIWKRPNQDKCWS